MKNTKPTRKSSRIPRRKEECVTPTSGHSKVSSAKMSPPSTRGRKRRNTNPLPKVTKNPPKIRKNTVEGREVDGYCWICHKIGQDEICKTCPRVYHTNCIPAGVEFKKGDSCPECQTKSVNNRNESPNISRATLKVLLKFAVQEALREDVKKPYAKAQGQSADNSKFCKYFKTWPQGSSDLLCQIVDLEFLIEKMNDDINYYLTTAQFFADVKWIYHNCLILHGSDSDITETALKLEKNFKSELLDIEACTECYSVMHSDDYLHADFFTVLCRPPHDIVWAKLRGSPFWPAKCLKIFNGHADVRFFGTHDKSTIPISQCYRISQTSPNGREMKQSKYQEAITELSVYVSNYQRIHGNFPYFLSRTPLDSKKSKNVKKSHRRGRRKRSSNSDREDFDDSDDVPAKFETLAAAEARIDSSDIPVGERVCTATTALDSTATEPVSVCMEFTTDDEATPFNSSSKMMTTAQPTQSAECLEGSTSQLPQASSSMHFINSSDPGLLPVITSAESTGISTEDHRCFTSENPVAESSENITNMYANDTNISEAENPSSNIVANIGRNHFDQDDDVQIILENRTDSPAVDAIKNSSLAHALCQISASNRPHLQKFYTECLDFAMRSYLHLGLPSSLKWQEESAVVHFTHLYEQVEKSCQALKKENDSLKVENAAIRDENIFFRQENQNLQKQMKECQEDKQKVEARQKNSRSVIGLLLSKVHPTSNKLEIETQNYINSTDDRYDECYLLTCKLKEMEKALIDNDSELKKLYEKIRLLENQLPPDCVPDNIGQSVESQTDLSDSPDNQMFTSKELQAMKDLDISYEENSSESQEEMLEEESLHSDSSSLVHSQILRHQTYTTNIQQSNTVIMYADEGATSNIHPIFESGSLVMPDCSLVQPITVVSTPSPLLMTEVMSPVVLPPMLPCKSTSRGAASKGKKRFLLRK